MRKALHTTTRTTCPRTCTLLVPSPRASPATARLLVGTVWCGPPRSGSRRAALFQTRHRVATLREPMSPTGRGVATGTRQDTVPWTPWRLTGTGSVIGMAMGFFGGLVGQGGGVVGIPMMTSLAKLTQHQAHGTSLIAVASTGLAGALAYWQVGGTEEGVDTLAALILTASATVLAGLGAKASGRVSSPNLKRLMGGFMIAASFSVAIKAYLDYDDPTPSSQPTPTETPDKRCTVLSFTEKASQLSPEHAAIIGAIGAATGFASGFLGIGGGLVMVPLLTLFTEMHQSQVLGTSLLAMVVPSVIGSCTHLRLGHVFTPIVPSMVVGSLAGAYLGGQLSTSLTQTQQRTVVAGTIFALAVKMLRKAR